MSDPVASADRAAKTVARVTTPLADLHRSPNGPRDRQVLYGETMQIHEDRNGWCYVQTDKDGYRGYVRKTALGPTLTATHWISAPSTHIYTAADLKSPDLMALSHGCRITVTSQTDDFAEIPDGFVPNGHITPVAGTFDDPLDIAALFLGVPYLWGGNSRFGIDCSGLVQAAFLACGRACPGDSGQQEQAFGPALSPNIPPRRGDLLFWKGHVALVHDPDTILHANAHRMAVNYEPLAAAQKRIIAAGDGPMTSHRRP